LPYSGWPFQLDDLKPFLYRAEKALNLGVGTYGDDFWENYSGKAKKSNLDPDVFSSFFWQFARSKSNPVNMVRMGPDFMTEKPDNVSVLVNATATCVKPVKNGSDESVIVDFIGIDARTVKIKAKMVVIACGALENARLLLASKTVNPNGLGNDCDQVGRYLMDHINAPVVKFDKKHIKEFTYQYGFFGLQSGKRVDMYMHGLGLNLPIQARDELVNAGAYCVARRAKDDPWDAVACLLRGKSNAPFRDIMSIIKAPGTMITGAGRLFLQSDRVPTKLKNIIVNQMVKLMPNFVVEDYQTQGVPHTLISCGFEAIVEQEPLPENRVMLSEKLDSLNQPLPLVKWEPSERYLKTLKRMGELIQEQFEKAGLPVPELEDWIKVGLLKNAPIIDTAHTSGTTRMSLDEKTGVVDENCKVRHTHGVYVAGGSVLPTCGHANPTLMIISIAIRLADHLKEELLSHSMT
jgi:hypothetical protein